MNRFCKIDDCDMLHCKRCGGHIIDGPPVPGGICDDCRANDVRQITEEVFKNAEAQGIDPYMAVENIPFGR